ncbi:DNA mismatch repair protein MutS [Nonlabens sp. Ci31]|jgi:dsDNA-specific endonuclease/ATPase MutS2|uniref:Smr/MutS family protein n=1 Tax=Nonlabens sp. Ci31 TaxID=2608253 RepID=UPI001463B3C1|nr:Smr/MutS family protein [Nonlabens sp. Ci31]QJP33128.1 DNA mismatch repair protein MutS [Nonlabens sp. Ci31]
MYSYKIGDRVLVLDDEFGGVVAFAKAEQITILTDDGIEITYHQRELILDRSFQVSHVVRKEEPAPKKSKTRLVSRKKAAFIPAVEIDLHIHQLVKSERGMDAYDKLNIQIDTARHKIEWAIQNRIPKLVFIHGVGQGVLKEELNFLFQRYGQIKFYDADYQKYGRGATEIYIRQNL